MHYLDALKFFSLAATISNIAAAPMENDHTCSPEEDIACYWGGTNGKRSPAEVIPPKKPTITACVIPQLGAPGGCVDGGGYHKRSIDANDEDSIVIGSKRSPIPLFSADGGLYGGLDGGDGCEIDEASYPVNEASYGEPTDLASYRQGRRSPSPSPLRTEDGGLYGGANGGGDDGDGGVIDIGDIDDASYPINTVYHGEPTNHACYRETKHKRCPTPLRTADGGVIDIGDIDEAAYSADEASYGPPLDRASYNPGR
jgi:hypothetical protein